MRASTTDFISAVSKEQSRGALESDGVSGFIKFCLYHRILTRKLLINNQRGFPDYTLFFPSGSVIFIEMKRPSGGFLSIQQKRIRTQLEQQKQLVYVCKGFSEARSVVEAHIKLEA
jgi:hypothetical protein